MNTKPMAIVNRNSTSIPNSFRVGIVAGSSPTVREAVAVPLLPDEEVRSPVVFVWVPTALLVTSIRIVQEAPAGTEPPE